MCKQFLVMLCRFQNENLVGNRHPWSNNHEITVKRFSSTRHQRESDPNKMPFIVGPMLLFPTLSLHELTCTVKSCTFPGSSFTNTREQSKFHKFFAIQIQEEDGKNHRCKYTSIHLTQILQIMTIKDISCPLSRTAPLPLLMYRALSNTTITKNYNRRIAEFFMSSEEIDDLVKLENRKRPYIGLQAKRYSCERLTIYIS